MLCSRCGIKRLVQVGVTLRGKVVVMNSCSECGTSWVDSNGNELTLGRVLKMASPPGEQAPGASRGERACGASQAGKPG